MTGGARVGWTSASWPLAKISANPDELAISIRLLGNYSFKPEEVATIEKYVRIPVLAQGIRICHCKPDYPQRVIFWCTGDPDKTIQRIRDSGFLPTASNSALPKRRGIAFRWCAIILAVIIWNALFLPEKAILSGGLPAPFLLAPLIFALAISFGTAKSPALQRLVLKPGRSVDEVRHLLRLLAFISGFLLVVFSILLASGALKYSAKQIL